MNFQEAQNKYFQLKQQLDSRQISPQQFSQAIQQLRLQDNTGTWWQLREDGAWLKWDGKKWLESGKMQMQAKPQAAAAVSLPEAQELAPGIKGIRLTRQPKPPLGTRIAKYIGKRIFMLILVFLFSWAFHTYLLVVKNEGFSPSNPVGKLLNTYGNGVSSTVIWGAISGLIFSFLYSLFTMGPIRTVAGYLRSPVEVSRMFLNAGLTGLGALCIGSGLLIFISAKMPFNPQANVCLGMLWMFFGLSQPGYMAAQYLVKAWLSVANSIVKDSKQKLAFNANIAQIMIFSMGPALMFSSLIPKPIGQVLGIVLLGLGIFIFVTSLKPKAAFTQISGLIFIGMLTAAAYALLEWIFRSNAFADDGGWQESGGTMGGWVKSQGAATAVTRGVTPAAASAAGTLTPVITPQTPPDQIPVGTELSGYVWFNPPDDEAGLQWMKKDDYVKCKNLMDQGYIYSKEAHGWMLPEDANKFVRDRETWRAANKQADIDNNAKIKAHMDALKKQQKDAQIKEEIKQKQIQAQKDKLDALEKEREIDNSTSGYISNVKDAFSDNVVTEIKQIPGQLHDAANAVCKELSDPDNWKAAGQAVVQTADDLKVLVDPAVLIERTAKGENKVLNVMTGAAKGAKNLAVAVAKDPMLVVHTVLGTENWGKVVDPKVPITERIGRAVWGSVDLVSNIAMGKAAVTMGVEGIAKVGGAAVVEGTTEIAKTAEVANDANKIVKAGGVVEDGAKTINKGSNALVEAKKEAKQLIDDLAKASTEEEKAKAALNIRQNQIAIDELNKANVPNELKQTVNDTMKNITEKADKHLEESVKGHFEGKGGNVEKIVIEHPSNVSKGGVVKTSHDTDTCVKVTMRADKPTAFKNPETGKLQVAQPGESYTVEMKAKDLKPLNDEAFVKATLGEDAASKMSEQEMKEYANKHYWESMGKDAPDAFNVSDPELKAFLEKRTDLPLSTAPGESITFKPMNPYNEGKTLLEAGDITGAENKFRDASNQLAKGWKQTTAYLQASGKPIPANIDKAVKIMSLDISQATKTQLLAQMGETPTSIFEKVGGKFPGAK